MKAFFKMPFFSKWLALSILMLFLSLASAFAAPEVNVMPDGATAEKAYTWVGNPLVIWGNVRGGTAPFTYQWDVNNDGTVVYSGNVTNINDISCSHTYTAGGTYDAKLTVTDANNEIGSAIVRIRVLPSMTTEAKIELAIEKGLKYLYLRGAALGGGIYTNTSYTSAGTQTAAAVLAFENRNHKPCTQDQDSDGDVDAADRQLWEKDRIYAETVHKGIDYFISTLRSDALPVGSPYDSNANQSMIGDNSGNDHRLYKIGSYMMALVGTGTVASGAPNLVATTGPAGVIGKTYRQLVQDMVDFCDYAQYTGSQSGYGVIGGWRYSPGDWPDNSACQWPAIGMEAAEFGWGIPVRQKIKDDNYNWINYSQYFNGYEAYRYYGAAGYTSKGEGVARTGAAMCQLSFQGKVKTDPRILAAAKYLGRSDRQYVYGTPYGNLRTIYAMYAVAKAARIAKVDTNSDGKGDTYSEIQLMDSRDWYSDYSNELINNQRSDGSWQSWSYTYYVLDTAWAVEVLTKNVFTLRPIADIVAVPSTTPAVSPVTFNINGSFHQDSARIITNWAIDVDNDGTDDFSGSTFPVVAPIVYSGYPDIGHDYVATAKLRVTDDVGDIGEDLITVNITSGNVAPVAVTGGPYNGVVGQPITFDGSGSFDPNAGDGIPGDTIVSYEWDLDGDGQYDDATGVTASRTWNVPYSGLIGLKVTDDAGLSATSTSYTQVFVVDLWPENYSLVSRRQINRNVVEYEYRFDMRNRGNAVASNVMCTLETVPAQVGVVDGVVNFGSIAGGAVVTSGDTFKFTLDRRYPVASFQIRWKLEYDDAAGAHQTFVDFPLY